MLLSKHISMDFQLCIYDIDTINLLAGANIFDYFKENESMRYDLEWAAHFTGNPLSSAR